MVDDLRDLRQRDIIPPDRLAHYQVAVVGVGAIGRQVALQLTAIGVPRLQLFDFDVVERVNLAPQGYLEADVDEFKVAATAQLCHQINPAVVVEIYKERFQRSKFTGNVLFCCVDKMDGRKFIWNAVRERAAFFADGRMSAEVIRILTATRTNGGSHYDTTLFSNEEAQQGACTAKSTIFTANIAAGLMVGQYAKWLRELPIEKDFLLNLLSMELTVTD